MMRIMGRPCKVVACSNPFDIHGTVAPHAGLHWSVCRGVACVNAAAKAQRQAGRAELKEAGELRRAGRAAHHRQARF